ncbi:division/cell wall cluster transcriptional repressor MraZ [Candidatus Woesebacteria bacterium]|nr:MAG: division/cell wall cluster transcriptional repressor MraZ [Candidatus Woesebacteria bacterium]
MIIGQFSSKLTDKDRLSVPKKFREEMGDILICARWYETCLVLVSIDGWNSLISRLIGHVNLVTQPVRSIDRFILGSAYEVRLDNQGRFIVPEILLQYALIKSDVVFVGLGDRVEIWALEKWMEVEESIEKLAAEAIEKIAKGS